MENHVDYETLVAWLGEQTWSSFATSLASQAQYKTLTDKQLAAAQNMYTKGQNKAKANGNGKKLDKDGLYVLGDVIYKVQFNQTKTNLYAKQLVKYGENKYGWDYAGGAPLYKLTEENAMTAEQAADFGKLYGICVNCGRTLTDEDSIHNGYGPTCAENLGWPYEKAPLFEVFGVVTVNVADTTDEAEEFFTNELGFLI